MSDLNKNGILIEIVDYSASDEGENTNRGSNDDENQIFPAEVEVIGASSRIRDLISINPDELVNLVRDFTTVMHYALSKGDFDSEESNFELSSVNVSASIARSKEGKLGITILSGGVSGNKGAGLQLTFTKKPQTTIEITE
ncbi:MAG: hypothetical protein AAF846_22875 [Chloroflexota bacterium]